MRDDCFPFLPNAVQHEEILSLFVKYDTSGDGALQYDEFRCAAGPTTPIPPAVHGYFFP